MGASARVVVQLPKGSLTPTSSYGYDLYESGWVSFLGGLVTDAPDSRITLTLVDGGIGDANGPANGNITSSGALVTTSLAIATTSLPAWTVNVPGYQQSVTATGGVGPYTFAVASGSLPPGLGLNPTTGAISGEPTSSASSPFSFTIGVHGSDGEFAAQAYLLAINPAVKFATSSLPAAMLKQSGYSQTLAVTGGTGSINYAVTSGALPAGMSLSATTGTITGAPTALGTSTFQVTATDSLGSHDVRSFSITVNPASAYDILIEPNLQNFGSLTLDGTAISTADVTHTLLSVGSHTLSYTGGQLSFRVSTLGLITYDPTLEGVLEGVDTSVLRIYPLGITVDATALSSTSIALQSRNYSNTEPIYLLVLPGAESLLDLSTNDSVAFTVSPAGSIGYDSSLQGILNGSGTSELIAKGTAITIDATALSTPGVQVDGREFNNTAPLSLVVLPGAESLDDLSTGDGVAFTVSAAGTIGYDPSLQGILNGSGTPELIAEGTAITVDATALSTPSVQVDGREFDNTAPLTVVLLPGAESLHDLSTGDGVAFTVSAAGMIDYDPSLQGILNGSETSELIAKGTAITVDATALSTPGLLIDGREFNNTAPLSLVLLPGAESLHDLSTGDGVAFTVSTAATIGYDSSLQGILDGSGTTELIAKGTAITVDATALSTPSVQVDGREFNNTAPLSLVVLPGAESFHDLSTGIGVSFTVSAAGTIGYDPSLQGTLLGAGTSTLIVEGQTITIDARDLNAATIQVDGSTFNATAPITFTCLPGSYTYVDESQQTLVFVVSAGGLVSYDPSLEGLFTGDGTKTLVIHA